VPATATVVAAPPAGACAACGATDGYDPDGFCLACGRRSVRPRDHMETDLVWLVGVTDKGPQKARNEDAYALAALPGGGMAVSVCDGVSNIPRSDEASQGACDAAVAVLAEAGGDATLALGAGAAAASAYVVGLGRTAVGAEPPSCTFLALTWRPGQPVSIGWIGDCRAYWVDDDGARRLTTDHSWGTEQVSAGLLSQDEADRDERSHAITRWLGADARGEPVPDVVQFEVGPGQRGAVVALSDGAWNYLSGEAELARLVDVAGLTGGSHRPLDAARRIVDHAIAGGGHDNITAALALIPPAGPHDSTDATEA
jgi:serine/threonine protein phosphatase PrpC